MFENGVPEATKLVFYSFYVFKIQFKYQAAVHGWAFRRANVVRCVSAAKLNAMARWRSITSWMSGTKTIALRESPHVVFFWA